MKVFQLFLEHNLDLTASIAYRDPQSNKEHETSYITEIIAAIDRSILVLLLNLQRVFSWSKPLFSYFIPILVRTNWYFAFSSGIPSREIK